MPGGEQGKGGGVRGMPGLQGGGQAEADGGVEAFQAWPQPGQPGVKPGVQGNALCLRLPLLHCSADLPAQQSSEAGKGHNTTLEN